mmetsp:Transcript_20048/g.41621  ORF Transcript_20048/g.41621 Transcript_20048/m.41621 type:complete len:102 (-) Transcript_20048:91-396(-)
MLFCSSWEKRYEKIYDERSFGVISDSCKNSNQILHFRRGRRMFVAVRNALDCVSLGTGVRKNIVLSVSLNWKGLFFRIMWLHTTQQRLQEINTNAASIFVT